MDETTEQTEPKAPVVVKRRRSTSWVARILLVILIATATAGVGYWWRDKAAKEEHKKQAAEISTLQQDNANIQKQLDDEKAKTAVTATPTPPAKIPSQALIDNIKAVFSSGNSAALEGYMAPNVRVIFAASDGLGDRTPVQATMDITNFMKDATDPWNFDLPAATLTKYQTGDYAQYFPANAVVGKTNEMVISFTFNSDNKISGVLMTPTASVL